MDSFSVLDGGGEEKRRGRVSFLQLPLSGEKCSDPGTEQGSGVRADFCFKLPIKLLTSHHPALAPTSPGSAGSPPCERQLSSSVPSATSAPPAEEPRRSLEQWLSSNFN
ncbi:hypothetical protein AV530_004954 [Patagioenas fasciata monilis]|uniref:Uncharacterized protein n=1 Tax=Patagioenas fasciata monilis TaxID=372326 RepID=A0A1V4K3E8_PATFA|nr:hypothetical protein AV530_004954 [Patagioenas fasciata monilis]